jgi:hypothetical protein
MSGLMRGFVPRRDFAYRLPRGGGMRVTTIVVALLCAAASLSGQGTRSAAQVIDGAASALGGKPRLLALKTLKIEGYGQLAYMNGGGNISSSPGRPTEMDPRP